MRCLTIVLICLCSQLYATDIMLTPKAEISVITCAPGDMIYDCFGHTAIRVHDPVQRIDWVYNYGIYDFSKPNFELNFARGLLEYRLGKGYFNKFLPIYTGDERTVVEQILDLDSTQKQKLFDFLEWNALPENQGYLYDYFRDNCATRVRDVIDKQLGTDLCSELDFGEGNENSLREMVHEYAHNNQWSALGIDLCLGMKIDQTMQPCEYAFLPDYMSAILEQYNIAGKPFVKEKRILYMGLPRESTPFFRGPIFWLWFIVIVLLVLYLFQNSALSKAIDSMLFFLSAFLGFFLLALWFLTDHETTVWNFNLIWAQPFLLPAFFFNVKWKELFFKFWAILLSITIIGWLWLPQELNGAFFPVVALLAFRAFARYYKLRS